MRPAIDVDAHKEVAAELRIEAMPTIIAFVDGGEFDRVIGAKKPQELLAWLDGVVRGETSLVVHKRRAVAAPADMQARLQLARELVRTGRYEEALTEHVWLWEHMLEHDPGMYGVRGSYFVTDLQRLIAVHAPARARFDNLFELGVIPLLIEAGRWADVATLYPDPLGRLDDEAAAWRAS